MQNVTLSQVPDMVASKSEFGVRNPVGPDGYSLRGVPNVKTGEYRIYSYATLMAEYSSASGWWENEVRYSVTTSRHMRYVRVGMHH